MQTDTDVKGHSVKSHCPPEPSNLEVSVAKTGVPDGCITSYLKDISEPQ